MNRILAGRRARISENATRARSAAPTSDPMFLVIVGLLAAAFSISLFAGMPPAYADDQAADETAFYAVLHPDGSLVFQPEASTTKGDVNYAGQLKSYGSERRVPWRKAADRVTSISFSESFRSIKPMAPEYWFCGMSNARVIDVTNLDTSQATSLRSLFENCTSLTEIVGIEGLDTSACTYMGSMFHNCASLKSLDLRNFDATKVTVMCYLFRNCASLETLDVSGPGWHTSALLGAVNAFEGCSSIKRIDLSSWDTTQMVTLYHGFAGCSSLEYLDLSSMDFVLMHSLADLFTGCDNLKTVKVSEKFSFSGNGTKRLCSLPEGSWLSSADGIVYSSADVPDRIATTYSRVVDEPAKEDGNQGNAKDPAPTTSPTPASSESTDKDQKESSTVTKNGATYQIVKSAMAILAKAPASKKSFTIPASVRVNGESYAVIGIAKGAFSNSSIKTLTVKTRQLAKKHVKGCFKGAKNLSVVKVPKGKAAAYRKLFTKKTSGKKVAVK